MTTKGTLTHRALSAAMGLLMAASSLMAAADQLHVEVEARVPAAVKMVDGAFFKREGV